MSALRWFARVRKAPETFALGADLGSRRVKLVILGAGSPPELVWSVDVPTPAGIISADGTFDSHAAGRVLAQLVADAPVSGPIPGAVLLPSIAHRVRRVPNAPADPALLMRTLGEDSELRIPGVGAEGLVHAAAALRGTPAGGRGDGGQAVVASARRDAARAYGAAGAAAGLRPLRLATTAAALANLHASLHPDEATRPVLLLHVGWARSDLVVVHDGAPVLALAAAQGAAHLLERVRTVDGAASPTAEAALHGAPPPEVLAVIDEWATRLCGSHRTALGAAEQRLRMRIDELPVRVSGGVAHLAPVVARLAAAIPSSVGLLEPASRWTGTGALPGPALALAFGAALEARAAAAAGRGEAASEAVLLDLSLPDSAGKGPRLATELAALGRDLRIWAATLVGLSLGVGVPAGFERRIGQAERALERGRSEYATEASALAADSAQVVALQADSTRLAGTLGALGALDAGRYRWPKLMHAVAGSLPRYAWLESLEMEPGGAAHSPGIRVRAVAPTQADVSAFEKALAASGAMGDIALEGSESLQLGGFALVGIHLSGSVRVAPADQPRGEGAGYHAGEPILPPKRRSLP